MPGFRFYIISGWNFCFWWIASWIVPWTVYAGDISVVDDAGNTIILSRPAARIVSLSPHITELLFAAGAGDRLVGVVEYSDFPEAAKAIERIGNHSSIDLERIASLKPDLIIAWESGNPKAAIEKLKQLKYPLFLSEPRSLNDIATSMQRFAELAGTSAMAGSAIKDFHQRYSQLKDRYRTNHVVNVFYEIWYQPLMTVNGKHIISEVIELCGGKNVFGDLSALAPNVSVESVLAKNPEAIIAGTNTGDRLFDWKRWTELEAVRFDNLFHVEWDHINRHSPRILSAVEEVCQALIVARKNIQSNKIAK